MHIPPGRGDLTRFLFPDDAARVEQDGTWRNYVVAFDNDGFQAFNGDSVKSILLVLGLAMLDEAPKQAEEFSAGVIDRQLFMGQLPDPRSEARQRLGKQCQSRAALEAYAAVINPEHRGHYSSCKPAASVTRSNAARVVMKLMSCVTSRGLVCLTASSTSASVRMTGEADSLRATVNIARSAGE